jgi:hypothetical protein
MFQLAAPDDQLALERHLALNVARRRPIRSRTRLAIENRLETGARQSYM